jgi:hypothetical protein
LSDGINNSKKYYDDDSKYEIESCCRDREELILAIVREVLKHEDLVKFAITHCDQDTHELGSCSIDIFKSIRTSF